MVYTGLKCIKIEMLGRQNKSGFGLGRFYFTFIFVSDELTASSVQFKTRSKELRRKMCCKNFKMTCILILVITAIIAVIVLAVLCKYKSVFI